MIRFSSFRLIKFLFSSAFFVLIWLTWRFLTGRLGWGFAIGSVAVSGLWLGITFIRLRQLLTTYFDSLSRLQVLLPMALGVALSVVAAVVVHHPALHAVAFTELLAWGFVYCQYEKNRKLYMTQGHGPLPANAWVNPPAEAWQPFDIGLFSGRMAERTHDSVGHGEIALRTPEGKMVSFTAYMENGCIIQDLAVVTSRQLKKGHYIVLRLREKQSPEKLKKAYELAQQMLADNIAWTKSTNAWRRRLIDWLPLPRSARDWLFNRVRATGYDWVGLFIGARAKNRWTCVGACLTLLERLGIKTAKYGTGVLGLGTGLLNPIMPVRFLADPAFHLLTLDDKKEWEAAQTPPSD